jgi:hypothetical protein
MIDAIHASKDAIIREIAAPVSANWRLFGCQRVQLPHRPRQRRAFRFGIPGGSQFPRCPPETPGGKNHRLASETTVIETKLNPDIARSLLGARGQTPQQTEHEQQGRKKATEMTKAIHFPRIHRSNVKGARAPVR